MNFSDEMKKVFLAGIGAIATTAEKTKEVIEILIEKGEITVEQGKIINEELKRNLVRNKDKHSPGKNLEDLLEKLNTLNQDELLAVKEKLLEMEKDDKQNKID